VTGLIAATHNDLGIAGVAPDAKIVSVRAVGSDGGRLSDLLAAVSWAAGISVPGVPANLHRAKVINLSIASESNLECDAISAATFRRVAALGAIVVTAAGNRSVDAAESFPANCAGIITVAASNFDGALASYSNLGTRIDIAAPGGDTANGNLADWQQGIISTVNAGSTTATKSTYGYLMGTSMSAPLVAGVLALMAQVDPRLSLAEAVAILKETAQPFASDSACSIGGMVCGPGIVNAAAAVELAALKNW
jgi:serine protease